MIDFATGAIGSGGSGGALPYPYKATNSNGSLLINKDNEFVASFSPTGSIISNNIKTGVGSFHLGDVHSFGSAGNKTTIRNNSTGKRGAQLFQEISSDGAATFRATQDKYGSLETLEPYGIASTGSIDYNITFTQSSNRLFYKVSTTLAEAYKGIITWNCYINNVLAYTYNKDIDLATDTSLDIVFDDYAIFVKDGQTIKTEIIKSDGTYLKVKTTTTAGQPYRKTYSRTWTNQNLASTDDFLIVAASNSIDKGRAKYICTGTDDQTVITKAFSDAYALNKSARVLLLAGSYNVSSSINMTSGCHLYGEGYGTKIIPIGANPTTINCAQRCVISDLAIYNDGNVDSKIGITFGDQANNYTINNVFFMKLSKAINANSTGSYSTISNCEFLYCSTAIDLSIYAGNTKIHYCSFSQGVKAITSTGANTTVDNCRFAANSEIDINLTGGGSVITNTSHVNNTGKVIYINGTENQINGVKIIGCNTGTNIPIAINNSYCIANNIYINSSGCTGTALMLLSGSFIQVSNCVLRGLSNNALLSVGSNNNSISNCRFISSTNGINITSGITNTAISGCSFNSISSTLINAGTATNVTISGCEFQGGVNGVLVGAYSSVANCKFNALTAYGIKFQAQGCVASNNIFTTCKSDNIICAGTVDTVISGNMIYAYDNSTNTIAINLTTGTKAMITGNVVRKNTVGTTYSFAPIATSDYCMVTNNYFEYIGTKPTIGNDVNNIWLQAT